jgi:catechol 2,3-dioxygenase-like lactoylglutathione lyase family enzyme
MVSELHVNDLERSLAFWREVLGFGIAYQRPAERFAYLEHPEGHQIMLCQRHGRFETGPLAYPPGQGVMLQICLSSIDEPLKMISARQWPLYLGPREVWRRTGDHESGQREFFVQDPDGYLLMIAQNIRQRPLHNEADGT